MNLFKDFKRNDAYIKNGRRYVVGVSDNDKEIAFFIARAHESNESFQHEVQKRLEAKRRTLDSLSKTDKQAETKMRSELVLGAFVESCIKGWENVQDETGADLAYGDEGLKKIATLPELVEDLFKFASTDSNYVGEFDEEDALKN